MRGAFVLVIALAGCFPTRTDALVCAAEADCDDGRTCEAGFCVVTPDAAPALPLMVDAPPAQSPDAALDAPPPRPCTGGDANAEDAAGNCYVAFKQTATRKTRAAAETACEAQQMTLAIVTAADGNAVIQSLIAGLDTWLGATDAATENTFLWPDGTPLTFTNFRAGEPNNVNNEDCLVIEGTKGGSWDDRPCGTVLPYVCSFSR